jgi:hypothetical protein
VAEDLPQFIDEVYTRGSLIEDPTVSSIRRNAAVVEQVLAPFP